MAAIMEDCLIPANTLATGYPRLLVQDLQLGTVQQLFLGPQNGKGPGDTSTGL